MTSKASWWMYLRWDVCVNSPSGETPLLCISSPEIRHACSIDQFLHRTPAWLELCRLRDIFLQLQSVALAGQLDVHWACMQSADLTAHIAQPSSDVAVQFVRDSYRNCSRLGALHHSRIIGIRAQRKHQLRPMRQWRLFNRGSHSHNRLLACTPAPSKDRWTFPMTIASKRGAKFARNLFNVIWLGPRRM